MAAPHNPGRYGETWRQERIDAYLADLERLRERVVLSGGWAWHFMSPAGHTELKHAHDHKDADIFVSPPVLWQVIADLEANGFRKVRTRFDKMPSAEDFRRYEKYTLVGDKDIRMTIDLFVRDVPSIEVRGWRVVEPEFLLSLYSTIHDSKSCFAVVAASRLIKEGKSPIGDAALTEIPTPR